MSLAVQYVDQAGSELRDLPASASQVPSVYFCKPSALSQPQSINRSEER